MYGNWDQEYMGFNRNLPFLFLASKTSLSFVLFSSVLVMITDFAPEESIRSIACRTV